MTRSKRVSYMHAPRDFPGRGAIKCEICGEPIAKHMTMDFCKGRKKT